MHNKGDRVRRQRRRVQTFRSVYDDELTIRGTAKQIAEKYALLAKEAVENEKERLLQCADHWSRQAVQNADTPRA